MLTIDIARLEREKTLQVDAAVPAEDPLWEETEFHFEGPLLVDMTATVAGSGEYIVRGRVEGTLLQKCRRCLGPVRTEVDEEHTLVFSPRDELGTAEADPETRIVDLDDDDIDLGLAIREELILGAERFVVCDEECKGLCPVCGIDRNEDECDCTLEEPDPRWDALRELKTD